MLRQVLVLLAAAVLALLVVIGIRRARAGRGAGEGTMALRRAVLTREAFKDAAAQPGVGERAVLFDWHVGNGTATLVAFHDGTTSLYLSSGGGVIGAGAHESVLRAAEAFRNEARKVVGQFRAVDQFPPPSDGVSTFYVVTDTATLSSGAIQSSALRDAAHPLHMLGRLAQDVITAIRKTS